MLPILGLTLLAAVANCHPQPQSEPEIRDLGRRPFCDRTHTVATTVTVATATATEFIYLIPTAWPPKWENVPFSPGSSPGPGPDGHSGSPQGPPSSGDSWDGWQKFPAWSSGGSPWYGPAGSAPNGLGSSSSNGQGGSSSSNGQGGSSSNGQGSSPSKGQGGNNVQPSDPGNKTPQPWPSKPASPTDWSPTGKTKSSWTSGSAGPLPSSQWTKSWPTSGSVGPWPTSGWTKSWPTSSSVGPSPTSGWTSQPSPDSSSSVPTSGWTSSLTTSGSVGPWSTSSWTSQPSPDSSSSVPTSSWASSQSASDTTSAPPTSVTTSVLTTSTSEATSASSTAQSSSTSSSTPTPTPWPGHTVTAYYGVGEASIYPPEIIPWQYLTHINYAFAKTSGEETNYAVTYDPTLLRYLSTQAKAHNVKLVLSVGGYGEGGEYLSESVATNDTRAAFVGSIASVYHEYELSGVDIDWEFVGDLKQGQEDPQHDAKNYLSLLEELRATLPSAELSAAVPMYVFKQTVGGQTQPVDMAPYEKYFDRVYLMCYDLWNEEDYLAGSNGALGPVPGTTLHANQNSGIGGVEVWEASGIPIEKLVYGVPFYGRSFKLTSESDPAEDGLYTPVAGRPPGDSDQGKDSKEGFWKWRNLKSQNVVQQQADGSYGPGPGWTYGYDNSTQTPYIWNSLSSTSEIPQLIGYDDPSSLLLKREYARSKGMNGMMFWAMFCDTDDGELTELMT